MVSAVCSQAQIEREGTPVSWNIGQNLSQHNIWQTYVLPDINVLLAEDAANTDKSIPFRFAFAHNVSLSTTNSGNWTNLHNGDRIWTLAIECVDAYSIGIIFEYMNLPRGGKIYLYSEDHRDYIGPITASDNRIAQLGTTHISGARLIIEYYEPYAYRGDGDFKINYISHAYRNIGDASEIMTETCLELFNTSVTTGRNTSASVLRMLVDNGQRVATATLINNTGNNGMPYVLTSSTAMIGQPSSWVFQFGVTNSNCYIQPVTCGALAICGAYVVRTDEQTGVTLLRLRSQPKNDWSAYYSGWKITETENTNSNYQCIQHALGLPQSHCFYFSDAETSDLNGLSTYRMTAPLLGGTFDGSTGSPLFDEEMNLVGIFIGGDSDCSDSGNDHFGMISTSWTKFREYLDPRQIVSDKLEGAYPIVASDDQVSNWDVSFFPNPAKNWIYIQTNDDFSLPEVVIHDAAGRCVMNVKPQVPTIDMGGLPEGFYTITFKRNDQVISKSLLIR
ncbi:MAG: T9SS type A sorting domain-containing protein [Flavobacteriales bacterium]|nr:T9SS type A sorting domain-containing protein [Flavobacteriales bacterium]